MQLALKIMEPGEPYREVVVSDGLAIGRHDDNDVILYDSKVSGHHARIVESDGKLHIEDLGSSNGVEILSGPRLGEGERHPLSPGLRLEIGLTRVLVVEPVSADRTMMIDSMSMIDDAADHSEEPTISHPVMEVGEVGNVGETTGSTHSTARGAIDDFPDLEADEPAADGSVTGRSTSVGPLSVSSEEADMAAEATIVSPPRGSEDSTVRRPSPSEVGLSAHVIDNRPPLERMVPRLVFGEESVRGVIALDRFPFTIGRADADDGGELRCALDASSVSARHAEIKLSQRRLFLEDSGSKNGTYLDGRSIPAMASRELTSDAAIRLGGVDALFVLDRDGDLAAIDRSAFPAVVRRLCQEGKIKRDYRDEALRQHERGQHPGEYLVLSAGLAPSDWSDAVRAAGSRRGEGASRSTTLMVLLFLVVFIAVGFVVWRALR